MADYLYAELNPILPEEWGAQVNYLEHDWTPWVPDKLVVHYGGNASFAGDPILAATKGYDFWPSRAAEMRVLRIYEQSHLSRGWNGLAYNYAIGQSGQLYISRGEQRSGATSGDFEGDGIPENHEARAVLFLLGGDQEPSGAALQTFRRLWQLTPEGQQLVIGHRQVKGTTLCPGSSLLSFIEGGEFAQEEDDEMRMTRKFWQRVFDLGLIDGDGDIIADYYGPGGAATPEEMSNAWFTILESLTESGSECDCGAVEARVDGIVKTLRSV